MISQRLGFVIALVAGLSFGFAAPAFAQEMEETAPERDLRMLVDRINSKLRDGKSTEEDLAEETAEFDRLIAKYGGQNSEDVATILYMQAALYREILRDEERALQIFERLVEGFPGARVSEQVRPKLKAMAIRVALKVGSVFPDLDEIDLSGDPLSISRFRGKVLLVDFWATWCGPCVREMPNVIAVYKQYHDQGFEIVGISLDQDKQALLAFLQANDIRWPQYFDGKGWNSELARKYGVESIPSTYLLDAEGRILAKNLRGSQLQEEVSTALGSAD